MSKNKKGAKAQAEDTSWDEGLISEKIDDELWHPYLMFLVAEDANVDAQLQALESVVVNGNRKKFAYISRKDIIQTAQEDAKNAGGGGGGGGKKSKQGSASVAPRPLHVQVCEHVVSATSSGEPLSPSLTAKMIKYMILKRRCKEVAEKKAIAEGSDFDLKKGNGDGKKKSAGTSSGRNSRAGQGTKKGKDTPTANDLAPSVPMPSKPPTLMKKRGEEDSDSKYLNDEPEQGPNCYFILTGFNAFEIFKHFTTINLKANTLIHVIGSKELVPVKSTKDEVTFSDDLPETVELNKQLALFWLEIDKLVLTSPSGSMLRDMARLDIVLKSHSLPSDETEKKEYCQAIFDDIAGSSYQLLEQYTQYQYYLEYLQIQDLPLPPEDIPSQEKTDISNPDVIVLNGTTQLDAKPQHEVRCYNDYLKTIPEELITLPMIVNAMVEQVSATVSECKDVKQRSESSLGNPTAVEISNMIEYLSLSAEDKKHLGIKSESEATDQGEISEQNIIGYGDEMAMRRICLSKSKANIEENLIKLAGLSSYFNLSLSSSPDQKADIHALNHLIHGHEKLTVPKFNHALILLSLESISLKTASTPPDHSYTTPSLSSLLFDHPFDLEIASKEMSLVPISEVSSSNTSHDGTADLPKKPSSYTLQLGTVHRNLENYSVLELFEEDGLIQELISLQDTHPYMELFRHQHNESLIIVAHTGFDGSPYHEHKLSSHTHTKVGFQNFLQYVAERYSHIIDEAAEEDELKKKEYEEERKAIIAQRIKEAAERHQEVLTPLEEEEQGSDTGKSNKKKSDSVSHRPSVPKTNPISKKSIVSNINDTPMSSNHDLHAIEASLQPFEKEKRFIGYDMGDVVLLKESIHSTLFTGDGVQVQSRRHVVMDGAPYPIEVSLLHGVHKVVCTQIWNPKKDGNSEKRPPKDTGIAQPPPQLKCASLHACFNSTLQISCSHYGPKANGELPFLPHRPKILDHPPQSDQPQGLHPPATQQGASPKLSKKQQEHQQQLLEQQRALEAQMEKERQLAEVKYRQEYNTLVRNNKYQQLCISTDFGLDVKCQVHSVDTDDEATGETFVAVKQSYSSPDTATHLNEDVTKEKYRIYHPEGYVIKCMRDDSVIILCADGTKYQSASSKEVELFNKHNSKKGGMFLFQHRLSIKDDHDTPDHVDKYGKRLSSATKAKITESSEKPEEREKQKIWAVTTPTGQCYLLEQENATKKEAPVAQDHTDQGNKENVNPSPSPCSDTKCSDTNRNSSATSLDSIHLLKATDPVTKEVYITREDKVILVQHPNGSYITEFGDGTRFTVSAPVNDDKSALPTEIVIECNGFSRVSYSAHSQGCSLYFPDGAAVECSHDGAYTVRKEGDYELSIETSGRAFYKIPGASYILDHTSLDHIFCGEDSCGNAFSLQPDGGVSVQAPNPISHTAFNPRYFLLNANKSCFELHECGAVDEIISQAKADPKVAVVRDSVASNPSITSTTVIEPVECTRPSPVTVAYQCNSIVPYNLRSGEVRAPSLPLTNKSSKKQKFGSLVGRGLEIGCYKKPSPPSSYTTPLALKYRQFLQMQPLDSATREQIHDIVVSFINRRREQVKESETMQPVEMRSASEVEKAESLNKQFMEHGLGDLPVLYEAAITSNKKESFHAVPPSMSQEGLEFIKKSKAELEAAEDTRLALRNKAIPSYFESKYVNDFLPLSSPDMAYLTSQLAQPRPLAEVQTNTKSQSTLQSSSLTLTLDESDSVVQAENASPTYKTHPTTPLPTNTPIEVRPHNPTPLKAVANDKAPSYLIESRTPDLTAKRGATPPSKTGATLFDVTGQPRTNTIAKPASLLGSRPGEELNMQYYAVEEPVRRKILTSSSLAVGSKLRGFEVIPEEVNFGVLREGLTYVSKFALKNAGIDFSRFKIKQPPPSTGIKVVYNPGPVAAGLICPVTVELFAIAVGAVGEHGTGYIYHELEIITQSNILRVPIKANVLTGSYYDQQPSPYKLAEGVELAADNTRKSVTRPEKT